MRSEATDEDRRARAQALVAYATHLMASGLNRERWDDATLSEVDTKSH